MKLNQISAISFDIQEVIIAVTLSAIDEWVMLLSSGSVVRFNAANATSETLFSAKDAFEYPDGGFQAKEQCAIYTLGPLVAVVNNYKRHGFLHYPGKYEKIQLWRGEYHSNITKYPVALFSDVSGVPYLAYAQDWNHLQVMNVDTLQILTATKSLIKENAEADHLAFYSKHSDLAARPWPSPYDYFYGPLLVSPDGRQMLSQGWVWGSADCYKVYDIADFISNPRVREKNLGSWEHENRPACWVGNDTVAITYNPFLEGDDQAVEGAPIEIHLYDVAGPQATETRKIKTELTAIPRQLYHYSKLDVFVVIPGTIGVMVIDMDGKTLLHDESIDPASFNPEFGHFISYNERIVRIDELTID